MESTAIEDPRVREAMDYYLLNLAGTAPKNTVRAYRPKQDEWKVREFALRSQITVRTDAAPRAGVPSTGRRSRKTGRPDSRRGRQGSLSPAIW